VCDGLVPRFVLTDAVAAAYHWQILGRFFERSVDAELRLERGSDGWAVFLRELWARPNWPLERFYESEAADRTAARVRAREGWVCVEASEELPDLEPSSEGTDVVLTVGGAALGTVPVAPHDEALPAQALRAALTTEFGAELSRAVVREGLIGTPLADGRPLRERLAAAAGRRAREGALDASTSPGVSFAPGWLRALREALDGVTPGLALARRADGGIGSSASRRAALPAASAQVLAYAAEAAGEPVVELPSGADGAKRVAYVPELIWRAPPPRSRRGAAEEALHGPQRRDGPAAAAERLPILTYRRVAGGDSASRPRVSPERFEQQLRHLQEAGFCSVGLEDWRAALEARRPLAVKGVLITFDGGYRDFADEAWPLLRRYGFSATVFLVTDQVGATGIDWDEARRLQEAGVAFGSLPAGNRPLSALSVAEAVAEGARSRAVIHDRLGSAVTAIAYPDGDADPALRHLMGACGYVFGLTRRRALSAFGDSPLDLPRVAIEGSDDLEAFALKLTHGDPAASRVDAPSIPFGWRA
jgi:peptidoglycan/xylan/chitin deacetylase (PgdA/CDA1 family)